MTRPRRVFAVTPPIAPALALCTLCLLAAASAAPLPAEDRVERRQQGQLVIEGIPEIPDDLSERLEQYNAIRTAHFRAWLPDGGMLVSTRFGDTAQIHRVERPGAARRQITFFDEPVTNAAVSPDPAVDGFLFTRDVGGSEAYQIFFFDFADGSWTRLTDGTSRNGAALWSNAGDRFAFFTTRRNGRDWDVHVATPERPGESRAVLEEGGTWIPVDWSPDDTKLLVLRYVSANESHPHVLDLATGGLTPVAPSDEPVAYGDLAFAPDGRSVYLTSDAGAEFKRLLRHDLEDGETEVVRAPEWDVDALEVSGDGRFLVYKVNEDAIDRLRAVDLQTGADAELPALPDGLVGGLEFAPGSHRLGLTLETATGPDDAYSLDLDSGELTRWTESEVGGLPRERFVAPELVHYESFDGLTIPAFYYRPADGGAPNPSAGGAGDPSAGGAGPPYPVVIDIHGGPEGQERPGFSAITQFWVAELGLAVLAPNVRGSEGYGKSYLKLDNARKREDSVKDIGALLDWIAGREELDDERVAVFGGSYGGYMVLASLVHYDERLRAGIDVVGISNFVTFLENTEDYRRDLRRVEYGDERDPEMREFLERISPVNRVDAIDSPLFVVQGANDPRVPASESEQMVEALREQGTPVWYLLALDEGHGFAKKENRDYLTRAMALFWKELLVEEPVEPAAEEEAAGDLPR